MKKLSLLLLAAAVAMGLAVGCGDNDDVIYPVTQQVQQALYAMYPEVEAVEWASVGRYLVADFDVPSEGSLPVEYEAWFTPGGVWQMSVSDVAFTALPEAVRQSFQQSQYGAWIVEDVDRIERLDLETVYVIEADNNAQNNDVSIYYTSAGVLIKSVADDDGYYGDLLPTTPTDDVMAYINRQYPSASILAVDYRRGATEVTVLDGEYARELYFDAMDRWLLTRTNLKQSALPSAVVLALDGLFVSYFIDTAALVQNSSSEYYFVQIESSAGDSQLRISSTGEVL